MNSKRVFRWKRFALLAFLILAACLVYATWDDFKYVIAFVLNSRWSIAVIIIYCIVSVVTHRLCSDKAVFGSSFAYSHFGKYADSVFAIATLSLAGTTSFALLNGIFMQITFNELHYIGFETMDLASVVLVSTYLMYYCLTNTTTLLVQVLFQAEASPITEVRQSKQSPQATGSDESHPLA